MATPRSQRPPQAIAARLDALRTRIQTKSVGGYLVVNRTDQYYLTGFDGEDGATLILPDRTCLITDGRFKEDAAVSAPWATAVMRSGTLTEAIAKLLRKHRLKSVAFEPADVSVELYGTLRRAIRGGGSGRPPGRPVTLVRLPGAVTRLRLRKDDQEVDAIARAIDVAESAFRAVVRRLRPGLIERDLAARLQDAMIQRGASEPSFPVIVAEGVNASRPHAKPGSRRIKPGSAVLIDWGATVDHYRSDLTRVVFVRRIPPRFRRMYENVLAAQREAIAAIRPGVRMCDVDAVARNRLKKAGMAKQFAHSLGHGIGLDIHEGPRLARKVKDRLEPGMVVTVEPGVYFPGVGGVRIEDDVLVTPDGHRVLTRLESDIDAMVI